MLPFLSLIASVASAANFIAFEGEPPELVTACSGANSVARTTVAFGAPSVTAKVVSCRQKSETGKWRSHVFVWLDKEKRLVGSSTLDGYVTIARASESGLPLLRSVSSTEGRSLYSGTVRDGTIVWSKIVPTSAGGPDVALVQDVQMVSLSDGTHYLWHGGKLVPVLQGAANGWEQAQRKAVLVPGRDEDNWYVMGADKEHAFRPGTCAPTPGNEAIYTCEENFSSDGETGSKITLTFVGGRLNEVDNSMRSGKGKLSNKALDLMLDRTTVILGGGVHLDDPPAGDECYARQYQFDPSAGRIFVIAMACGPPDAVTFMNVVYSLTSYSSDSP